MRYMSLLMRLAVVMLPLFLTLATVAHAQPVCSELLASDAPPVARSLRPFLARVWNDTNQTGSIYEKPRVQRYMQIIEKAFARPSLGTFADGRPRGGIIIEPESGSRDLDVDGGWRVQTDGTLNIHFTRVAVLARSEFSRAADNSSEYGDRPKGSAMMMADLVAAVLGSAHRYASTHPGITGVLIRAQSLRNPSLIKMLLDSGFAPAPVESNLGGSYFLKFEISPKVGS